MCHSTSSISCWRSVNKRLQSVVTCFQMALYTCLVRAQSSSCPSCRSQPEAEQMRKDAIKRYILDALGALCGCSVKALTADDLIGMIRFTLWGHC